MKFVLVSTTLTLVVGLSLLIDVQSRAPNSDPPIATGPRRIYAPGRIEGKTPEIELRTQIAGRIVETPIREGQLVETGELLLRLDDAQYQQEVALAQAELDLAEAQRERLINGASAEEREEANALFQASMAAVQAAELKWERIGKLREARAIAQQEADDQSSLLDVAKAQAAAAEARAKHLEAPARADELHSAEARIATAAARLDLARTQLDKARLLAPCRARVLKLNGEPGELTGPTSVEPAVILVNTDVFQVRAYVEELDASQIEIGMDAQITADAWKGRRLHGRVVRLSPRMSRKEVFSDRPAERLDTKVREIWIELREANDLVVGLPVDVIIEPLAR